ncbi:MAG: DUF5615 family PIN-like protein [Chloroflexota bacterium]|nr:DUF5615 family PIN-like protein [Chloroflexota bacterium]
MRIKLDENLDVRLASILKQAGHDTNTVHEQGLRGTEDEGLYQDCKVERRILVSLDLDFSNIIRFPPEGTPGVVVLRGPNQLFPTMRILVDTLIDALNKELPAGRLWIVEPGRLRIHEETESE